MKTFLALIIVSFTVLMNVSCKEKSNEKVEPSLPNFVIIFTDDQGYQDVGCFGAEGFNTPNLDKMADEGMKLTSFYAQTVCGPSRAALMTASYPLRVKRENDPAVPHPAMSLSEVTMAEVLKAQGYKSGIFGKWDLAGRIEFNPNLNPVNQGFDTSLVWGPGGHSDRSNLYDGEKMIGQIDDKSSLTKLYTDKAIDFIKKTKEPFFLYLAHTMPHTPLFASKNFKGKTKEGLYGDVIEEIDFNVGRLMEALKDQGIDENTYVIFTSDNGPWWIKGDDGGHCAPLRGAKTSAYEGGLRVPCIVRAPGRVPAGVTSDLVTSTIDLLPTLAKIANAELPADRVIDGVDISEVLHGNQKKLERSFFFYQHETLRAVRMGDWKLFIPGDSLKGKIVKRWPQHVAPEDRAPIQEIVLYNLKEDIGETTNVAAQHPEIVNKLLKQIEFIKDDLGYDDVIGKNSRKSVYKKP
ncbi:sulfatase [Tamlana sp. 62-3]|uniref:Sulfatase n=1 Tax=Neotamlana sargassicola TaxID=2883125 RepID=A0A9X1L458_9FLAO|nr:sulfatase [Tamlana sargassicola]MCB4807847.1 sulfatase [Tamlana sargassicola]